MYKVEETEYESWTEAQDEAVRLLESGVEWVEVLQWSKDRDSWCLLQQLNLEEGIMPPSTGWNTSSLTPYYVSLRNYEG